MLKNTSKKHILKNEKLAKENTKNLGKCMEKTLHTDPSHQSTGFCFPKTWHGTSPPHLSGNNINYTWTYMNYERFYSHNYNHNYINKDFMKKGCMTCSSSCLWKVSCYFSGVAPLPTDNDFWVLWFFLAAFLQHCSTFTTRTGSGGHGVWASDGWVQAALLSISHTCPIIMTCIVGCLSDTLIYFTRFSDTAISPWVAESLQVDADHLFCTTGHPGVPPAWLAGRWEWPPGLRKTTVAMRRHEIIQEVKILLLRRSTALSLYMSYSQNLP